MSNSTSSESTSPSGTLSTPASTPSTITPPSGTPLAYPKHIPVADRMFFSESDLLSHPQAAYMRGMPSDGVQLYGRNGPTQPSTAFQEMNLEQPGEEEYRGAEILYKMYLKDTASKLKQIDNSQPRPVQHLYPEPYNIPPPEQAHTREFSSPRAIHKPDSRRPVQYHWTMPPAGYAHVGIEYSEYGHARVLHRPYPEMFEQGQASQDSEEVRRMWAEYQARHWGYQ